jgi:hypothetical protein
MQDLRTGRLGAVFTNEAPAGSQCLCAPAGGLLWFKKVPLSEKS